MRNANEKRFSVIGKVANVLELDNKNAISIELQEGKSDNEQFELVIQAMYNKSNDDGSTPVWAYKMGGIRVSCNPTNLNFITRGVKAMFEIASTTKKEVVIKASKVTTSTLGDIGTLSTKEIEKLLEQRKQAELVLQAVKTVVPIVPTVDEMELLLNMRNASKKSNKKSK